MPKNTVHGGPSWAGNPDPGWNPDATRAVAEGREPDGPKSAFIGVEVSEEDYKDAMKRHGTDEYTDDDKRVVENYRNQRSDDERAEMEKRDGVAPGSYGRNDRERFNQQLRDERDGKQVDADADAEDKGGAPSVGTSSSSSETTTGTNVTGVQPDPRPTVHETGTRSKPDQADSSTARSTGTSGKAKR